MATILISYDIHPAMGEACEKVIDAIMSLGTWWHHIESTWIVRCDHTPEQIRDILKQHVGSDDQLLIVDISQDTAAWFGLNEAGSKWLEESLQRTSP
jgi:hypothetical protein